MPCPDCGYDLRGTIAQNGKRRCPECGSEVAGRVRATTLPWVRRRKSSRLGAYVRTLLLAIWRPGFLQPMLRGPVERRSAEQFERITFWIGVLLGTAMIKVMFL